GKMHAGRWYPTIVPLADGKVFVASGVTKLIKPLYPDHPPTDSGRNVVMTETYTPSAGVWADNGRAADRSLPLFPRLALIPGGRIIGTTPGTYFAVSDSRIDTVERDSTKVTSASTGSLNQPRWYGTGVLTPTGEVIAFSGASADEVDGPGTAIPVTTPELFD